MKTRKTISNAEAFERYRRQIEREIGEDSLSMTKEHPELLGHLVAAAWSSRYCRRRYLIDGVQGWGDPLTDQMAKELLVARHRARDAAVTGTPPMDPDDRELLDMSFSQLHSAGQLDAARFDEPHGFGPSLRRLLLEAADQGLTGKDAWMHAFAWAHARPPAWDAADARKHKRKPAAPFPIETALARAIDWVRNEDLDLPWKADVEGQTWQVRLNDFPDEPMYTLLIDGVPVDDFHDWPVNWASPDRTRADQPAAAPLPPLATRPTVEVDNWLDRYTAGEHEQVWAELVALGPLVREEPYLAAAEAVAQETMRRARHNVELIVGHLEQLDYRFWDPRRMTTQKLGAMGGLVGMLESMGFDGSRARGLISQLGGMHAASAASGGPQPFTPAARGERRALQRLERQGCVLPLSVRAWIEVVGQVDLNGSHPTLCAMEGEPHFRGVFADPLMFSVDSSLIEDQMEEQEVEPGESWELEVSFDDQGKAGLALDVQVDDLYSIAVPNPAADALLQGERHQLTFVEYLRLVFRWGGFPGWEGQPDPPTQEIAILTEGLLPI